MYMQFARVCLRRCVHECRQLCLQDFVVVLQLGVALQVDDAAGNGVNLPCALVHM